MGMITGAFGGVLRDILINEQPLFFRKDIYATACIAGGVVYWLAQICSCGSAGCEIACALTIVALRMGALRWNWQLPVLAPDPETADSKSENKSKK
jgi:uncharacterized membrane protein YeiH